MQSLFIINTIEAYCAKRDQGIKTCAALTIHFKREKKTTFNKNK